MENLWETIAKARGVAINEEFSYSWDNYSYKYRINEKGLEIYEDGQWYSSSLANDFIRGVGEIERLPFRPKMGENYWTYSAGFSLSTIEYYSWGNSCYDKERKLLGIVFKTEQEAKDYLPTWRKRLEGEEM